MARPLLYLCALDVDDSQLGVRVVDDEAAQPLSPTAMPHRCRREAGAGAGWGETRVGRGQVAGVARGQPACSVRRIPVR